MSKQMTRQQSKHERRRERREEHKRLEEQRRRSKQTRRFVLIGGVVVLVAAIIGIVYFASNASKAASNTPPTGPNALYPPVDGIACEASEQLAYHIHSHISIYVNGQPVALPEKIGIASDNSCIYWLHVHANGGVIHIESPQQQLYTLGNFLDLWGGRFSSLGYPTELNQNTGWQAYVNGKPYTGDFRNIKLDAHTLVTLAFQSPDVKPDTVYNWPAGE